MFDIGFWEISLIGVIGLLVLGPERLPGVARVVGGYLRKARQTWAGVRSEISRELAAEDLKKAIKEPVEELRSAIRQSADDVNRMARETVAPDEDKANDKEKKGIEDKADQAPAADTPEIAPEIAPESRSKTEPD